MISYYFIWTGFLHIDRWCSQLVLFIFYRVSAISSLHLNLCIY